ncbi:MAG: hypothetical protein WBP46_08650 [Thiolinea sp.]
MSKKLISTAFITLSCYTSLASAEQVFFPYSPPNNLYAYWKAQESYKDPRQLFITMEAMDAYFKELNSLLKSRNPEQAAQIIFKSQPGFLLEPTVFEGFYPKLPNENSSDQYTVSKICPMKRLEGNNDPLAYVDLLKLDAIANKKQVAPRGTLIRYKLETRYLTVPDSTRLYQKQAAEFARRWNKAMLPLCMQRAGILDLSTNSPVQATHQVIGDTLFILNEQPLRNPKKDELSPKEEQAYQARLKQALQRKNPEAEAQQAIAKKQLYLLGWVQNIYFDVRSPNVRRPTLIDLTDYYGIHLPYQEKALLKKACPTKVLEGNSRQGQSSFIKLYTDYATRWNQQMLGACRAKLKK